MAVPTTEQDKSLFCVLQDGIRDRRTQKRGVVAAMRGRLRSQRRGKQQNTAGNKESFHHATARLQ